MKQLNAHVVMPVWIWQRLLGFALHHVVNRVTLCVQLPPIFMEPEPQEGLPKDCVHLCQGLEHRWVNCVVLLPCFCYTEGHGLPFTRPPHRFACGAGAGEEGGLGDVSRKPLQISDSLADGFRWIVGALPLDPATSKQGIPGLLVAPW